MTIEEKELLLKDLSARLPYGVKCNVFDDFKHSRMLCAINPNISHCIGVENNDGSKINPIKVMVENIKPYLFPLSSMTEEQRKEFNSLGDLEIDGIPGHREYYVRPTICSKANKGVEGEVASTEITQDDIIPVIDWLNKNHFDYRGLIEEGLAIDATNLNIY